MKYRALLLTVLLCSTAQAEPNAAQWLKIAGGLRDVAAANTATMKLDEANIQLADAVAESPCLVPENPDVELALSTKEQLSEWLSTSIDFAEDIRLIHLSKWNAAKAGGSGSWPRGCHSDYPDHHSVTFHIDRESFPSQWHDAVSDADHQMTVDAGVWGVNSVSECRAKWGNQSVLDVMLDLCIEAARRRGIMHVEVEDKATADILVRSKFIPGGTIGYAYYNNGTCGDVVTATIDSSWDPRNLLHNGCWLNSHEWCGGHCSNVNHFFTPDQGIMSYANLVPYQGWRRGDEPGWTLGADRALPTLAKHYGTEPVPIKGGDPDPPPTVPVPPGKWTDPKVGDVVTQTRNGVTIELTITKIGIDQGETFADKIRAAVAAVDYTTKANDQATLSALYDSIAKAVRAEQATVADGIKTIQLMRGWMLGEYTGKWKDVFTLADSVTTAEGLESVARGFGGAAGLDFTPAQMAEIIKRATDPNAAISPEILDLIKLVVSFLPPKLQVIVRIVLAIMEGLPAKEPQAPKPQPVKKPDGGGPVQKSATVHPRQSEILRLLLLPQDERESSHALSG